MKKILFFIVWVFVNQNLSKISIVFTIIFHVFFSHWSPHYSENWNYCADLKRMSSGKILPDSVKFQFLKNWKIHNFISIPKQEAQETKHMSGGGMAQAIERDWSPRMQRTAIARDVVRITYRKQVARQSRDHRGSGGGKSTTIASMFCKKCVHY